MWVWMVRGKSTRVEFYGADMLPSSWPHGVGPKYDIKFRAHATCRVGSYPRSYVARGGLGRSL